MKRTIEKRGGYEKIQLVTISRLSAYGEYEPYRFMDTEEEFEKAVVNIKTQSTEQTFEFVLYFIFIF